MLSGLGLSEILLILLVTLVVIGPEKIPDVARMLGKGLREVRKATDTFRDMFMIDEADFEQGSGQLDRERRSVGPTDERSVANTISREAPPPALRPVLMAPARRATGADTVELTAVGASSACIEQTLTAPAEDIAA